MRQEQYIADLGAMVLTGLGKEELMPYETCSLNLKIHSYIKSLIHRFFYPLWYKLVKVCVFSIVYLVH